MSIDAREGWLRSEGLRLRFLEWGRTGAPAVVALHGLRSFAMTWEPLAQAVGDRYRVIALDQRGRGDSDWDPLRLYHAEHYVRDLEALLDHLALRRVVLLGHSMGGANAIVHAGRHPDTVAGLIIEDMGPGASAGSAGAERIRRELQSTPMSFASRDEALAYWRRQRPTIAEAALQARVEHSMRPQPDGRWVWRHDAEGIAQARLQATPEQLVDLWPSVEALKMPTLLLRGARSDFLSAATAEAMVTRQRLLRAQEIADAGHYVHDDNPPAFLAAVEGFLAGRSLAGWRRGEPA